MPEAKPTLKKCPECGEDLTDRNPRAHALDHWPEKIEPTPHNKDARKRQAQLYEAAEALGM